VIDRLRILFILILIPGTVSTQNWESIGDFNMYPTAAFADSVSNKLYVGGYFTIIDNEQRWGAASWNNSSWDSLGLGLDYDSVSTQPRATRKFLRDGGYLYAVGAFMRAGTINTNGIARWNGTTWDSVPGCRIPDYQVINDIIKYNGEIYICGTFDSIGSISAHGLAKWDGSTWQVVANNYGFTVPPVGILSKICFYHGRLYVAGVFEDPNGNTCRLARWDGWNWHFMTTDVQGGMVTINDMEVYQDRLYVGGLFFQSAGNVANSLQSWNDTTWNAVGGSVQILSNPYPTVCDMTVHDGKLYCVGNFEKIGGVPAHSLAAWDGTDWCGFGTSFDNRVTQIAFYNDTMHVSGGFWSINGDSIAYIAKWTGGNYVDTCGHLTTGVFEARAAASAISVFPNPSSDQITVTTFTANPTNTMLEILDATGKRVDQISFQNTSTLSVNCARYPEGIYLLRVISDGESAATEKLLINR
jgi:hypothetical protein